MKFKAAIAAFAFVAISLNLFTLTWFFIPPELTAISTMASIGIALYLSVQEKPVSDIGSGWLTGLVLGWGLLCLIAGVVSAVQSFVGGQSL